MAQQKKSRHWLMLSTAIVIAAVLAYVFRAQPVMVDMGKVARLPLKMVINEEAKTRVRNAYLVSTPITGRVLRVEVEPGDVVIGGETVIARMLPANPAALDIRSREQANAAVTVALAGIKIARAELNKAIADKNLADSEFNRIRDLYQANSVSQSALEQARQVWQVASASFDTAKAGISMREAELANARAQLISFSEPSPLGLSQSGLQKSITQTANIDQTIPLHAPISGRILRVIQKSETTLGAGSAILEIGDISNDLEIIAELLSTDAVQVSVGDQVVIDKWGQSNPLNGIVERVEPWGFTKFSALGVEEQRVNSIIKFTDPAETRKNLGHGFRVEVQIVIWQKDNALTVPSSALFRDKDDWAIFLVEDGKAKLLPVEVGQNNGIHAEILSELNEGERIILYPGPAIENGVLVLARELE